MATIYIAPGRGHDTTDIQNAIDSAQPGDTVVFRDGTYQISEDIDIKAGISVAAENQSGARIVGSMTVDGVANSAPTFIVADDARLPAADQHPVSIEGFAFENVAVETDAHSGGVTISDNSFVDVRARATIDAQSENVVVKDNALLASDHTLSFTELRKPGGQADNGSFTEAILVGDSVNALVQNNIVGGLNADVDYRSKVSAEVIRLAERAADQAGIDINAANYFSIGVGGNDNVGTRVLKNAFYGATSGEYEDPATGNITPRFFDHANYFVDFKDLTVEGNYFNGWPPSGQGGVKIRNGDGLEFFDNHLEDISLYIYTYNFGDLGDNPASRNWNIYNNLIENNFRAPIYYDETNQNNGKFTLFEDIRIFDNILDSAPTSSTNTVSLRLINTPGNERDAGRDIYVTGNTTPDGEELTPSIRSPTDPDAITLSADRIINAIRNRNEETDDPDNDPGTDAVTGGPDADALRGDRSDNNIFGHAGNDTLVGGSGDDFIAGHRGADWLRGGAHSDTLFGGNNSDTLVGGKGDDVLRGDSASRQYSDTFLFNLRAQGNTGDDEILDFDLAEDTIQLAVPRGDAASSYAFEAEEDTGDLIITFDDGGSVTLAGVDYGERLDVNIDFI